LLHLSNTPAFKSDDYSSEGYYWYLCAELSHKSTEVNHGLFPIYKIPPQSRSITVENKIILDQASAA